MRSFPRVSYAAFAAVALASFGACAPPSWPTDPWSRASIASSAITCDLPPEISHEVVDTHYDGLPVRVEAVSHREAGTTTKSGLGIAVVALHLEHGAFRAEADDGGRTLAKAFADGGMHVERVARVETAGLPGYELEIVGGGDGTFSRNARVILREFFDRTTLYITAVAFVDAEKLRPIGAATSARLVRSIAFTDGAHVPPEPDGTASAHGAAASGARLAGRILGGSGD